MTAALLAFLGALICGLGARDQLLVIQLTARHGRRRAMLVLAVAGALLSTAVAIWMAGALAALLVAGARDLFVALTLAVAGLEMLFIRARPAPDEPTGSLGAFAVVVLAHQLGDAARLTVGAIALATGAILAAGLGGGLGAALSVLAAWLGAEELATLPLQGARRILGAAVVALAALLVVLAF